jgi:DNA-binding protein
MSGDRKFAVDVGATDVKRTKHLQLDVTGKDSDGYPAHYSIRVSANGLISVEKKAPTRNYGISTVHDLNEVRDVIAYVLRRAICRGIDTAEVIENNWMARVDLGEMP